MSAVFDGIFRENSFRAGTRRTSEVTEVLRSSSSSGSSSSSQLTAPFCQYLSASLSRSLIRFRY